MILYYLSTGLGGGGTLGGRLVGELLFPAAESVKREIC
jgi:hypothetical protein